MEKEEDVKYAKGFNTGYTIAKNAPSLMEKLVATQLPENTYFEGFITGKEQHEMERAQEQLNELKNLRDNANDRDMERNK
ncbi:MAG: hypothetical protein R2800_03245 [Flavipsychrobacter sp.]